MQEYDIDYGEKMRCIDCGEIVNEADMVGHIMAEHPEYIMEGEGVNSLFEVVEGRDEGSNRIRG